MRKPLIRRLFGPIVLLVLLTVIQGSYYLSAFGPLTVPDAGMHIGGSWSLATGQWAGATVESRDNDGNVKHPLRFTAPRNIFCQSNGMRGGTVITDLLAKGTGSALPSDEALQEQTNVLRRASGDCQVTDRANQYSPIVYIPQALGMSLAQHMPGWDSWTLLKASRIATLTVYLIVGLAALVLSGRGAWCMAMVLGSPVAVFCAAAGMADANVIAYCALYVAVAMALRRRGTSMGWPLTILVAVMTLLLLPMKTVYLPLALLFLILPERVWPWKRKTAAVMMFALMAAIYLATTSGRRFYTTSSGVNMDANASWMLSHPIRTALMLARNTTGVLTMNVTHDWLIWLLPILVVFVMLRQRGRDSRMASMSLTEPWRISSTPPLSMRQPNPAIDMAACVIVFLSMMLVCLTLALTWAPGLADTAARTVLSGFQERYLWPLLPLTAVCAANTGDSE